MNGIEYFPAERGEFANLLRAAMDAEEVLRLKGVGMDCGCQFTRLKVYDNAAPYDRYEHSVGVALIVWNFTKDPAQALAGLFHDIATPAFAHTVDFMKGDYILQEETERGAEAIIRGSVALGRVLKSAGLSAEDVADSHKYPIADNPSPMLSADRLEYTLGNLTRFGFWTVESANRAYRDLSVSPNGTELWFSSPEIAERFALDTLLCSRVYASPENRYAMQILSEILSDAIRLDALSEESLHSDEARVIERICAIPSLNERWKRFCALRSVRRTDKPDALARRVSAKKRFIDPYVAGIGRVSDFSRAFVRERDAFLSEPMDEYLTEDN